MKLKFVSESNIAIGWAIRVVARLIRVSSRTTVLSIACNTAIRITRMLTFLLPLKVILLAGSNGMPRAFQPFLADDQRQKGIIILSLVAILSYVVTLVLESQAKRLSKQGSQQFLAHSGVMWVVSDQTTQASKFFSRFLQVCSGMLFSMAALVVIAIFNAHLAGFFIALICCFFLATAWIMENDPVSELTRLQKTIIRDTSGYLNILSSILFLTSFLIIIYPFILGEGSNILVALVSFILMRQMLSALVDSVKNIPALYSQRYLVDTLLFSKRSLKPVEGRGERATRTLFARPMREERLAEELADLVEPGDKIRIDPLDASVRQALEFTITLTNETMSSRVLRQRVFPPQIQSRLRNEDLLFELVDRDAIGAPPLVRRYFYGEHECVITDVGLGDNPRAQDWSQVRLSHLETVWALEPPAALASIYAASHSYLHQRLTDALISRMEFALTSQSGEEILTDFVHRLPQFRDRIARLPLCLVNRDQSRERMLSKADGGYYQLDWCDWCLEPAGFGLGKDLQDDNQLSELILHVGKRRPSFSHSRVSLADLQLTKCCADLEQLIIRGKLVAGLALASEILEKFSEKTRSGLSAV
ncbi:MAG: hypothetical protein P1V13_08320 [Rhizobiaceae bacterium]|nr:hypothetical protein [Rhizobiaceae bacterium]